MLEVEITNQNFEEEVLKSEIPVLVDFYATWCGPCKMLSPIISEIAEEYQGKIKVGKVNVDEQTQLAIKFQVASIPTLILFKNGNPVKSSVGFQSKLELEEMLE